MDILNTVIELPTNTGSMFTQQPESTSPDTPHRTLVFAWMLAVCLSFECPNFHLTRFNIKAPILFYCLQYRRRLSASPLPP
jgi:hypothetical protein